MVRRQDSGVGDMAGGLLDRLANGYRRHRGSEGLSCSCISAFRSGIVIVASQNSARCSLIDPISGLCGGDCGCVDKAASPSPSAQRLATVL